MHTIKGNDASNMQLQRRKMVQVRRKMEEVYVNITSYLMSNLIPT